VSGADNNDYHEIDAGDITPGVMVYENECGEKAAILDDAILDGTIVLDTLNWQNILYIKWEKRQKPSFGSILATFSLLNINMATLR